MMLVVIAVGLLNKPANIMTPCSVKAKGIAVLGRFFIDVVTICDDI